MVSKMAVMKAFNKQPIQRSVKAAWEYYESYKDSAEVGPVIKEYVNDKQIGLLSDFKDSEKALITHETLKFLEKTVDLFDQIKKATNTR